jgi:hypothetical protein
LDFLSNSTGGEDILDLDVNDIATFFSLTSPVATPALRNLAPRSIPPGTEAPLLTSAALRQVMSPTGSMFKLLSATPTPTPRKSPRQSYTTADTTRKTLPPVPTMGLSSALPGLNSFQPAAGTASMKAPRMPQKFRFDAFSEEDGESGHRTDTVMPAPPAPVSVHRTPRNAHLVTSASAQAGSPAQESVELSPEARGVIGKPKFGPSILSKRSA